VRRTWRFSPYDGTDFCPYRRTDHKITLYTGKKKKSTPAGKISGGDGHGGEENFIGESAVWFKVQKHGRFRINMPFAGAFSSAAHFAKLHKNGARSFVVLRGRIG